MRAITKAEALSAVRAAAFRIDDLDSSEHGRTIVHCFMGSLGADWDLSGVERLIQSAEALAWDDGHLFGHPVAVLTDDGRRYHFQGVAA